VSPTRAQEPNAASASNASAGASALPLQPVSSSISQAAATIPRSTTAPLPPHFPALAASLALLVPPTGHCRLSITRSDLYFSSYKAILKLKPRDLRKRLMVKFEAEEGLDYGGISREWLELLAEEIFNPIYGLFLYLDGSGGKVLGVNPESRVNEDHLSYFQFIGRILGICIFHGHHININLALYLYKMLLGREIGLEDIRNVDEEVYNSLKWIL
jgi:E3 ubiquitin ligase SMURF1/2